MATYASYKQLTQDNFNTNSVGDQQLALGAGNQRSVLWVYSPRALGCGGNCSNAGGCVCQACGFCCLWTVPSGVTCATFEIWSGGGGGAGHTCCNCCSFGNGGAGGNYAIKNITTAPGCTYTICAGGSWPCDKSHTCSAGMGCSSYVTGFNLSNFCVTGGCGGWMCNGDAWGPRHLQSCANCNICGIFGADFGIMGSTGNRGGFGHCHCKGADWGHTGSAPMIGLTQQYAATESWCTCGCYVNWPAGGGLAVSCCVRRCWSCRECRRRSPSPSCSARRSARFRCRSCHRQGCRWRLSSSFHRRASCR